MKVNIGDIVEIKYYDFDGNKETGLFLVYAKDQNPLTSFNVIKVCTKPVSFQIFLPKSKFNFLDHDSYANCICQQKFRENQVCRRLGMVNTEILAKVRKQIQNISIKIDDQLEAEIKRQNIIARINKK